MNRKAINFQQKFSLFTEQWQPKVVAEMNDYQFKIVRLEGDFIWHDHKDTDETFIVLEGKLRIDFKSTPRMSGALEHWQYDTFVTHFDDKTIEPAYVTFVLDADGKVERITMKAVSPLADFSYDYQDLRFEPVAAKK